MIAHPYIPTPAAPPPNPPPHRGGGPAHAQHEPGGGASPASSPQASSPKPQASPLHPHSSPASPQDSGLKTQDSPLHPSDSALLEALASAPSIASYAKSNDLCLTNLALWLQQPHIADAHQALLHLKALDHRTWQEQVTKEAIDTLRETMKASEDLVERRRCANTILRALTRTNRPTRPTNPPPHRGGGSAAADRAQHEPGGGASPASPQASHLKPQASPSSASTHPSSFSLHPSASPASPPDLALWPFGDLALSTNPTCPEVLEALDNKKPAPFPDNFATTPESCADHAVARLCNIPDPTGHRLYLAIYDALDIDLRDTPGHWDPFKRTLEASHFVTCRPLRAPSASSGSGPDDDQAWTRTDHPLERQPKANTATRRYTFTNHTTGETKSCTLALAPRNPKVDNPNHWWITHLITPNTS